MAQLTSLEVKVSTGKLVRSCATAGVGTCCSECTDCLCSVLHGRSRQQSQIAPEGQEGGSEVEPCMMWPKLQGTSLQPFRSALGQGSPVHKTPVRIKEQMMLGHLLPLLLPLNTPVPGASSCP